MNRNSRRSHSIDTLFVITLLGLFLIFLLMMLLFSTQAYRTAVEGNQENNNLYTASAYITEKFRQHDSSQSVSLDTLDNLPAFCMTDTIDGTSYVTYIYLLEHQLKELFTAKGNVPSPEMGISIASLETFQAEETSEGFYRISMEDLQGHTTSLLLHPGPPVTSE